jgi:hypothetical protein
MPLDPNKTAFKEPSARDWALLPEDTYQVQITEIKEKTSEYQGQSKQVLEFEFTVIETAPHELKFTFLTSLFIGVYLGIYSTVVFNAHSAKNHITSGGGSALARTGVERLAAEFRR